jgi:membrane fusion protein (multidrug efflux system)
MNRKFLLALGGVLLLVLALAAVKMAQIKQMSSMAYVMPPASVTTVTAEEAAWPPVLHAIATLSAVEGVNLAADADGIVVRIAVENGAAVKAGDLLLELDTTVEAAQLASAEARLANARLDADRARELRASNTNSQAELDAVLAALRQAEADAAALRASLDKKSIRAPFDGRVGIRRVNLGQFVQRGTPLLPLQRLNQMYVDFSIPQRQLPLLAVGQEVRVRVDAFPDRAFEARLSAIDPAVDAASRNVAVQALLENPDEVLRAGMFARAEVVLPLGETSVVVPATAVAYAAYGNSVFVIEQIKDPKGGPDFLGATQRFVRLGPARGDQIAILEGVRPGEQVATAGVFKLRNNSPVQVNNTVQPSNSPAPTPPNT